MKTHDEIKRGLECCVRGNCSYNCPYLRNCVAKNADALALIQQLEAERDALYAIVAKDGLCETCKHHKTCVWEEGPIEMDCVA